MEGACAAAGLNFVQPDTPMRLNVGGQIFETTAGVLTKDRFSILAGLCRAKADGSPNPVLPADTDGSFYIERDWFVFRHILNFLRSEALPQDPLLLEEMYSEATFYRLRSLRESIEKRSNTSVMRLRTRGDCETTMQPVSVSTHPAPFHPTGSYLPDPFNFNMTR